MVSLGSLLQYEEAKEIFLSTHKGLSKSDEKTIAVSIYSYFVEVLGWGIEMALSHTKNIVGREVKTLRGWRDEFFKNKGNFKFNF